MICCHPHHLAVMRKMQRCCYLRCRWLRVTRRQAESSAITQGAASEFKLVNYVKTGIAPVRPGA